jgi:hypothetical protein
MISAMTAYQEFCRLRDQRRAGEEAPQHTEEQALDLAISTHIGAKHIAQVTNLRGLLTTQLAEIENQEKVAYALRLKNAQLVGALQRIASNVSGDLAVQAIARDALASEGARPGATPAAASLPQLTPAEVKPLTTAGENT